MKMAAFAVVTVMLYMTVSSMVSGSQKVRQRGSLNRIIGGRNAREFEFPCQVSLQKNLGGMHFCGGSILNEHNILTAAHCSEFTTFDNILVVAGLYRLSHRPVVETLISKIFLHEKYDTETVENDIAIIAVPVRLPIGSARVDKISLASSPISEGSAVTVTGWGFVKQKPPILPDILQAVEIFVIGREKCHDLYLKRDPNTEVIKSGMICAGNTDGGKDSCNGDSGGPAIAKDELVGLVSWGPTKCGNPDIPGVYTDVYYYRPWILSTLNISKWMMSTSTMIIGNVLLILLAISSVVRL